MLRTCVVASLIAMALAVAGTSASRGEALPQWLPVATLDKALNDAAADLRRPHRFVLRDCGNSGGYYICTYSSERGIGVAAWSSQPVGLVEQINVAIPPCHAIDDLSDIAAMMLHILHPRRPIPTFSRAIVAMSNFAARKGSGEYWLDGVSYHLVDRGRLGVGLAIQRTPPSAVPPSEKRRLRTAKAHRFYLPHYDCPSPATVLIETDPPALAKSVP